MHAYRILLPSETDDSRFNSHEKHMLTDSVQPYNKPIIDLACSVCTVKYQTSLLRRSVHTKKPRSDILQYRPHARSTSLIYFLRYISTLYVQEKWPENSTCEEFAAHLRKRFNTKVLRHFRHEFGETVKKKQKEGQPVAFTDVFGMAIGDALLQVSL